MLFERWIFNECHIRQLIAVLNRKWLFTKKDAKEIIKFFEGLL